MFQFRAFPSYAYFIQRTIPEYCSGGFPHSEISGSTDICSSPKLIAACHVLLRLLMPRHSPCALYSLTFRRCGLHILRCNASVSAHPFRHISSSRHKRLRWFVTRVRRGTALASFSTSSKRFWFSWIMQAIYRLLRKIVIAYPHLFRCSTIKISQTSFNSCWKTSLLPCFSSHSSLFSFQGAISSLAWNQIETYNLLSASIHLQFEIGGDSRDRTGDLLLARQALSQLSYIPIYLF